MLFEQVNILDILPQRPPFVMVDTLLWCDRETTRTAFTVRPDNIFCDNAQLTASGVMENVAQTCAARMGYINKYVLNDAVKVGFIGAIRNMEFVRLPHVGERLITQITTLEEVFQLTMVNASVSIGTEVIAACEMKIAVTDITKDYE
jgi:predicted hotdog family 3-hydroxylacyl-ACP dehydratase